MKRYVRGLTVAVAMAAPFSAVMLLLGGGGLAGVMQPGVSLAQDGASCSGVVTQHLSSAAVRICDPVTVTTHIEASCADCLGGFDLVFVEPLYISGSNFQQMNAEALRVIDMLARHPEHAPRVAVVQYERDRSRLACVLGEPDGARGALRAPRYGSNAACHADHRGAARIASKVLADARAALRDGEPPRCQIVIYLGMLSCFATAEGQANMAAFRDAVRGLQMEGVSVFTGCAFYPEDGCEYMRQVVPNGYYAYLYSPGRLANIVEAHLLRATLAKEPAGLALVGGLAPGLDYETDSAVPRPLLGTRGGRTQLTWQWVRPDAGLPQTVTYRVRPLAEGAWPITASLTITDTARASVVVPAQPVTITVSGLCEAPTASPSPSATASPSTTATDWPEGTPTARPTATATTTPAPRALFLPLTLVERCDPQHRRADVALVIDTSSSMAGPKLEDAKSAAAAFVGQMDLGPGRDQVAVVRYDTEAEVACGLTNARPSIEAAIRQLTLRSGTHIDKGLRTALTELQSPRRLERNMSVMILLTDGIHTGTPGEELRAAAEVRAAGVRLYTIGLGPDADGATLREMAGDDARYHFAPDSADLARIYGEIASDIQCPAPPGGFWPGR